MKKVVLFGEIHFDKASIDFIYRNLDFLQGIGLKAISWEAGQDVGTKMTDTESLHKSKVDYLIKNIILRNKSIDSMKLEEVIDCVKYANTKGIISVALGHSMESDEFFQELATHMKFATADKLRIRLYKHANAKGINHYNIECGMFASHDFASRDWHMANKISEYKIMIN